MPPLTGAGVVLAKVSFSRVVRGAVYMVRYIIQKHAGSLIL